MTSNTHGSSILRGYIARLTLASTGAVCGLLSEHSQHFHIERQKIGSRMSLARIPDGFVCIATRCGKGAHTTACVSHTVAPLAARSETSQGTDFEERATIFFKK